MKKAWTSPIVIILLLAMSRPAFAPIFGFFPGLDKLISQSDAIAVVDLLEHKFSVLSGLHQNYEVYIRKVIKGEIAQGKKMTLSLRFLPYVGAQKRLLEITVFGFRIHERHIVFLRRKANPDKAPYSSLNCAGGHMQVSHQSDLSKLKVNEPKQIISELLEDFVRYKRQELENLEYQVKIILGKE